MIDLTASSLADASRCPASHALPVVRRPGSEYATDGHSVHGYLAAAALDQDTAPLLEAMSPRARAMCQGIDTEALWSGLVRLAPEASFRVDVDTGQVRILGYNLDRQYPARGRRDIDGTTDLVTYDATAGHPVILEYKTGRDVGPVECNMQLQFAAYCMLCLSGAPTVECRLVYVGSTPARVVTGRFSRGQRGGLRASMQRIWARVQATRALVRRGLVPDVQTGEACTYCEAKMHCPAYAGAVALLLGREPGWITREEAGEAWEQLRRAEAVIAETRGQLTALAAEQPLPLANGRELAMVSMPGRAVLDVEKALSCLRAAGYTESDIAALYREGKPYMRSQERARS